MSRFTWLAIFAVALGGGGFYYYHSRQLTPDTVDRIMDAASRMVLDEQYKQLNANEQPVPLALKRKVLADNAKVFEQLRIALQHPFHTDSRNRTADTSRGFAVREFSRLIARQEEVQIADRDVKGAIDSMAFGFDIAQEMERSSEGSALAGVSIADSVIEPIAKELGKLQRSEAAYLMTALKRESDRHTDFKSRVQGTFEQYAQESEDPYKAMETIIKYVGSPMKELMALEFKNRKPLTNEQVAEGREEGRYLRTMAAPLIVEAGKPRWLRVKPSLPGTPPKIHGAEIFQEALDTSWKVLDVFDRRVAWLRLFAVQTEIRLYQLQHHTMPSDLAALNDSRDCIDPFTGKTFIYRLLSKGYLVYSIGANGKDDGGRGDDVLPIPHHTIRRSAGN